MDTDTKKQIEGLRDLKAQIPNIGSWIRNFRRILGMTQKQLAARLGISSPSLYQLEQNEIEGKISIKNLDRVAQAMDCELVYFLVPKQKFKKIRKEQAQKLASKFLEESSSQALLNDNPLEKEEAIEKLVEKLVQSKHLWNDDPEALKSIWAARSSEATTTPTSSENLIN